MTQAPYDDLMLLWRKGSAADVQPGEVARLAGRAAIRRFDRTIFWRNTAEYAAGIVLLVINAAMMLHGRHVARGAVGFAGVAFVMVYLWAKHRNMPALDPAADGRSYQAAMLDRIDRQMRLLRSIAYWYLLPLFPPGVMMAVDLWPKSRIAAVGGLAVFTLVFGFVGWLNRRVGVAKLETMRAELEGLGQEQ